MIVIYLRVIYFILLHWRHGSKCLFLIHPHTHEHNENFINSIFFFMEVKDIIILSKWIKFIHKFNSMQLHRLPLTDDFNKMICGWVFFFLFVLLLCSPLNWFCECYVLFISLSCKFIQQQDLLIRFGDAEISFCQAALFLFMFQSISQYTDDSSKNNDDFFYLWTKFSKRQKKYLNEMR